MTTLPNPWEVGVVPLWPDAAEWLGIRSRSAAHDAANRGDIPTLTIGNRRVVSVAELLQMAGMEVPPPPSHDDAGQMMCTSGDTASATPPTRGPAQLRQGRMAKGLSLREMEDSTGIHFTALSRIETGKKVPSVEQLVAIARAIGDVDLVDLLAPYDI